MPDSFDYTTGTNSENVRLLQALIDEAPEYTEETNSRNANILKSIINNTEYTDAPQSEIEELLLRLKAKIGGEIEVDELNVTENGTYDAGVNKAYNPVKVELPLSSKTITENGTYTASDDNLAGFNEVTVAVQGYAKKSIANAPTPIATFNASALPMPSLTVGIEAVQDLHGHDAPWVGGAGKNKFNPTYLTNKGATLSDGIFTFSAISQLYQVCSISDNQVALSYDYMSSDSNTNIYLAIVYTDNTVLRDITACTPNVWKHIELVSDSNKTPAFIRLGLYADGSKGGKFKNVQLESGNQATTFAPYSNICPINGWSAVNVYDAKKNLFDKTQTFIKDKYIDINGNIQSATYGWEISDYIPLKNNTSYFISGNNVTGASPCNALYDKDKNLVRVFNYPTGEHNGAFSTNANEYYIRICTQESVVDNVQIEVGTSATTYELFSGTTYTTTLKDGQGNPMTCYGGQLTNENGVQRLTVTHGYIASYNGETLPSTWISDRDVYAEGTTPTTGAEVVYTLATPQQIPQDSLSIATQEGANNLWADSGDIQSGEYLEAL